MRKRIIQMGVYLNSLPELKAVLIEELTVPPRPYAAMPCVA